MEQRKIRLKAYETFVPREGWLTKGLIAVGKDPRVFTQNFGADALGVGTNMAKAIRYWMRTGGLTHDIPREGTELTELGRLLLARDPYFEQDLSLWLVHAQIALNAEEATSWYVWFNRSEITNFSKAELQEDLLRQLRAYVGVGVKLRELSVAADAAALLLMYCREKEGRSDPEEKRISPFAGLGLIRQEYGSYRRRQPDLGRLPTEAVHYLLARYFRSTGEGSVSMDAVAGAPELPGKLFFLSRPAVSWYLDRLAANGVLAVNRTAGLDMVYELRQRTPEQVAAEYYEKRMRR